MATTSGPPLAGNDNIGPDTPLRLADALRLGFPAGGMTLSGLRREAALGRLPCWRIAGKDFTSLASIEEMKAACRRFANQQGYGNARNGGAPTASSSPGRHFSSSTEESKSPRALALVKLRMQREHSRTTSQKSTAPTDASAI